MSSYNLYKELLKAGHKKVYLLELASGEHGKLTQCPEHELYRNVIHAFYQENNLPHNKVCAQKGICMLSYCKPTYDEIAKKSLRVRSIDNFLVDENECPDDDDLLMLEEILEKK